MNKLLTCLIIILTLTLPASAENVSLFELLDFLEEDKTDENERLPWYTCGHYARDVAKNSGELNIGCAILSNHPTFRRYDNHLVNYVYIDNNLVFLDAETDFLYYAEMSDYRYVRLYEDGTMVPSYWRYNMAHDIDLWEDEY